MSYYPFANGQYTTAPGLHKLGTDFGNGKADQVIFQLDEEYPLYWQNKVNCRKENIHKYYQRMHEQTATLDTINQFILQQLLVSYPQHFHLEQTKDVSYFTNHLVGKTFSFNTHQQLTDQKDYTSLLDALVSQVPEDVAVWQMEEEQDYLSTIHLCAPNHWSPEDKIGKPFSAVHEPVADMEVLRARYQPMLKRLIQGGSYVRFAWGLGTDTRLNHHPEPPPDIDKMQWQGRQFDPDHPELYVRVERQTLTGFPEVQAVLFTIRTYFINVVQLSQEQRAALQQALCSMSEDALRYKGLYEQHDQIIRWIEMLR